MGLCTRKRTLLGITSVCLLAVAAASVANEVDGAKRLRGGMVAVEGPPPENRDTGEYVIALGDLLQVKFFYNETLNEEIQVRPDGRISLSLVGEIMAAGRTPSELDRILTTLYSRELDDPEITVIVRTFNAQRAYVMGEVGQPGEVELSRRISVLQGIALAGDFLGTAQKRQVLLVRREESASHPTVYALNLRAAQDGLALHHDVPLRPYDIVYVPRTRIANVNRFMDQYIRQNLVFDIGIRVDEFLYDNED